MTDQLSASQTSTQESSVQTAPSGVPVPEREADLRAMAESSREKEWRKPSFAKELYLGRFRLDLIHPHPTSSPEDVERGEKFLAELRDFCEHKVDGALIDDFLVSRTSRTVHVRNAPSPAATSSLALAARVVEML